jgi:hypothetical protein
VPTSPCHCLPLLPAAYRVPRPLPVVVTEPAAISSRSTGRSVVVSVPASLAICSPEHRGAAHVDQHRMRACAGLHRTGPPLGRCTPLPTSAPFISKGVARLTSRTLGPSGTTRAEARPRRCRTGSRGSVQGPARACLGARWSPRLSYKVEGIARIPLWSLWNPGKGSCLPAVPDDRMPLMACSTGPPRVGGLASRVETSMARLDGGPGSSTT